VRTATLVTSIDPEGVSVRCEGRTEKIPARTVLWAAGVQASPLGRVLADQTGAALDCAGRVLVEPDCSIGGHPDIFVIGDLASFGSQVDRPLAAIAPVAMQQGRYVATLIRRRLQSKSSKPFRYRDRGNMAVIGRGSGVADVKGLRFNGFLAWLAWLFIHLMYLVEFENRLLVLVQWAWNYLTWNRGARLITGENPLPLRKDVDPRRS
jgi:NADH dehydrogenase